MSTYLEIDHAEVRYGNIVALKDISLSVAKGEIVSLIGANGAGKSTLLKAIAGIKALAAGSISFNNEVLTSFPGGGVRPRTTAPHTIVEKGISLVPEGRGVFADMTVLENLEMGAFLKNDAKVIRQKLTEQYDRFPILCDRKFQKAGSLSGGEQQMLAIARALMAAPELLLLDEPALGLAPLIIRQIFNIIIEINRTSGVTILIVEQNAKMALQISHHGHVLETGRIILSDTGTRLLADDMVKKAYLGEL